MFSCTSCPHCGYSSSAVQCMPRNEEKKQLVRGALTFIASQLSTLMYSVALASGAAASTSSSPHPTAPHAPLRTPRRP